MGLDLFIERDFLDAETLRVIVAELRCASGAAATVYGRSDSGAVDERTRRTTRLAASARTDELVRRFLNERMSAVEEHFGLSLERLEEPQFLRYEAGDFFVAHQDGNTGMLRSERESRRVSAVIFLNQQTDSPADGAYCGGALVFHPRGAREPVRFEGEPGTLVAFRAETTHEVEPVTDGVRLSIASWYR